MSPFVQPATIRRADVLLGRSVLLVLLAVLTATFTGLPDNPDAEVEFQSTSALVRTHGLALGGTHEAEAILAYEGAGGKGFGVMEGQGENEGRYYSWFGLGQALAGIPLYFIGAGVGQFFPEFERVHAEGVHYGAHRSEYFRHLFVGWRNPLLTALTAWILFLCARRLGVGRRSAYVAGLSYGLSTFAWGQGRSTLSDVQATFFLFGAFYLIVRMRERLRRMRRPTPGELATIGLCLGMAFLTRLQTAPAILVLVGAHAVVLAHGRGGMGRLWVRDLVWMALPALGCVALFLYANQVRFGDMLESGYGEGTRDAYFSYPFLQGFMGLLVAPGKGLFWLAPAALLLPFGIMRARQRRSLLWLTTLALLFAATFAPYCAVMSWAGGPTFGPRYVLPFLPFLWIGVAMSLDHLPRYRFGLTLANTLFALGIVTNLPAALVDHMTHFDLAQKAAHAHFGEMELEDAWMADAERFNRVQWDFRFAAPWAHWRILRHRVAGLGEAFPVREVFFLPNDAILTPEHERDRGFRHLAWVDFRQRLGGTLWLPVGLCVALLVWGILLGLRGFDPAQT